MRLDTLRSSFAEAMMIGVTRDVADDLHREQQRTAADAFA
jgi:hypothetical protein